ncbi:hypothetical protein ACTXT7_010849 [Hymenolepis weldensis]
MVLLFVLNVLSLREPGIKENLLLTWPPFITIPSLSPARTADAASLDYSSLPILRRIFRDPIRNSENLTVHMVHQSFNHPQERGNYRCYHCLKEAKSLDALDSHISSKAIRLYHCPLSYCTIKSPSKLAVIDHAIRVHGLSSPICIQASVEYICKYKGNFPSYLRSYIAAEEEEVTALSSPKRAKDADEKATLASSPLATRRMDNPAECKALCLRCPKCNLSTRIWDRFQSHLKSCIILPLSYTIYWCPKCSTVSTERDLMEEHVQEKHDSQQFPIALGGNTTIFIFLCIMVVLEQYLLNGSPSVVNWSFIPHAQSTHQ